MKRTRVTLQCAPMSVYEPAQTIAVAKSDNSALRVVASKSHKNAETEEFISRNAVSDYKSAGSSLKFCLVATGEADPYPRLGSTISGRDNVVGIRIRKAILAR